jgi:antirestriction protein ArdC
VRVRSSNGLARYSFGNQLLIALQCPEATYVAGFRAFLKLNRVVRRGERAMKIFAPMSVRVREAEQRHADSVNDGKEPTRIFFHAVSVFDVSQTDALPGAEAVPLGPPSEPITGASHAYLLIALERLARELGYSVARRTLEGPAEGWCDTGEREIVVNDELAPNAQVRVLVHELAHALGVGYREHGRRRAEVIVDTVTAVVCGSVGLDTSGSSVPYVAGWGEDGDLDAIRTCAETIDRIARRIEDSLHAHAGDAQAAGCIAA